MIGFSDHCRGCPYLVIRNSAPWCEHSEARPLLVMPAVDCPYPEVEP